MGLIKLTKMKLKITDKMLDMKTDRKWWKSKKIFYFYELELDEVKNCNNFVMIMLIGLFSEGVQPKDKLMN